MKQTEYQEFRQLCVTHGCKCTPQRLAVYRYVVGNTSHPNVNQIWESVRQEIPSITRESVFRILNELADFGVINRMDKIIDARFDGLVHDHGHLICERCGKIVDFPLPQALPQPVSMNGFEARHTELRISGLCSECAAIIKKEQDSRLESN